MLFLLWFLAFLVFGLWIFVKSMNKKNYKWAHTYIYFLKHIFIFLNINCQRIREHNPTNKSASSHLGLPHILSLIPVLNSLIQPSIKHVLILPLLILLQLLFPRRPLDVLRPLNDLLKYHTSQLLYNVVYDLFWQQGHVRVQHAVDFYTVFPVALVANLCYHVFGVQYYWFWHFLLVLFRVRFVHIYQ